MSAIEDAQQDVKPDMTPMIDVVFLMIIFFLCIDFKILEAKLPAYLPKDKGSQSNKVDPVEQLSIGIYVEATGQETYKVGGKGQINPATNRPYRFALKGHQVKWVVGPKPVPTLREVEDELKRIKASPDSMVPDPKNPGTKKLMAVVIEAHPGVYYESVAKTADACHAAGFDEINFGGGLGAKK